MAIVSASSSASAAAFYITGGTLPPEASSYVTRQADTDLYENLLSGEYCYVLNSRQMGKSSLCVRTIDRLQEAGVQTAFVDLTKFGGKNLTPEQWYAGLLSEIGRGLGTRTEFLTYWKEQSALSPLQRLFGALQEVALTKIQRPVVVFVDEIDVTRSLLFSTDEFFAAIRQLYVGRATDPHLKRLAFCLLGTATPAELIQDTRVSPFNIGKRIALQDFTPLEAVPLAQGMAGGQAVLDRVLHWTGGHPYLTQRLCRAIAEQPMVGTPADVDRLCSELFLTHKAKEADDNLAFVRNRLLKSEADLASLMDLYGKMRAGKHVPDDETNPLCAVLKLSGVAKVEEGMLRVRNRIYEHVFDRQWVIAHMPDAELRRQKQAYKAGMLRTSIIASCVILVMAALAGYAFTQRNSAQRSEQKAQKARTSAQNNDWMAQQARTTAEQYLADSDLELAAQIWESEDGSAAEVQRLLEAHSPKKGEQPSFAWRYQWTLLNEGSGGNCLVLPEGIYPVLDSTMLADGAVMTVTGDGTLTCYAPGKTVPLRKFSLQRAIYPQACTVSHMAYALSPDGKEAYVGDDYGRVHIIETATGHDTASLNSPDTDHAIGILAVSLDGTAIAALDDSGRATVWNRKTERLVRTVTQIPLGDIRCFTVSGGEISTLGYAGGFMRTVALSGVTNNASATQLGDQSINATKANGKFRHSCSGSGIVLSADGSRAATTDDNGKAILWNTVSNSSFCLIDAHAVSCTAVTFSPDGQLLATGGNDGSVRVWKVPSGKPLYAFKGQTNGIVHLRFSPDGKRLLSAAADGSARVWRFDTSRNVQSTAGGPTPFATFANTNLVESVVISTDGKELLAANRDNFVANRDYFATNRDSLTANEDVKLWAISGFPGAGRSLVMKDGQKNISIRVAIFSPDQHSILVGTMDGKIIRFDRFSGKRQQEWQIQTPSKDAKTPFNDNISITSLVYSPDGRVLAAGFGRKSMNGPNYPQTVAMLSAVTGRKVQTLTDFQNTISDLLFSPDGKTLIATCHDQLLRFYQKQNSQWTIAKQFKMDDSPTALAVIYNGRLLAIGRRDGVIELRDLTKPNYPLLRKLTGHSNQVGGLAFTPDGTVLASASWDRTIKLWDTTTGREIRTLRGHKNWVNCLTFTPDGKSLVSGDGEGRLLMWEAAATEEIAQKEAAETAVKTFYQTREQAYAAYNSKNWKQVISLLTPLLETFPDDLDMRNLRANAYAEDGDYRLATSDFKIVINSQKNYGNYLHLSYLLMREGDRAGYHKLCEEIRQRFSTMPLGEKMSTYTCLFILDPTSHFDMNPVVHIAEHALKAHPSLVGYLFTGLVCYRAGKYKESVEFLDEARKRYPETGTYGYLWVFRAMSLGRLGEATSADRQRQYLTEAEQNLKQGKALHNNDVARDAWLAELYKTMYEPEADQILVEVRRKAARP